MRSFIKYTIANAALLVSILFCSITMGFEVPDSLFVGDTVTIEDVDENKFYAVFLPFGPETSGMNCSSMSGADLLDDSNLRNYGTCFINDPGVFTVIEIAQPYSSSYEDLKREGSILEEKTVTLRLPESSIINDISGSTYESTSTPPGKDGVLGLRTKRYLGMISENLFLIAGAWAFLILSVILIYVLLKKHRSSKRKK